MNLKSSPAKSLAGQKKQLAAGVPLAGKVAMAKIKNSTRSNWENIKFMTSYVWKTTN